MQSDVRTALDALFCVSPRLSRLLENKLQAYQGKMSAQMVDDLRVASSVLLYGIEMKEDDKAALAQRLSQYANSDGRT